MATRKDLTHYFKERIKSASKENKQKVATKFIIEVLEYESYKEMAAIYKDIMDM